MLGEGKFTERKSSAANIEGKNLGKSRKEKIAGFLVAGHLGKGLVEFVRDGLEFLLFVDQLIFKSVDFLL